MELNEKKVEAVLFAVGKEITPERISSLCALSIEETTSLLEKLSQDYAQKDHSLQLVKKDHGWKLTVRDEFVPLVSSLVSSTELERPLMETLAVIAWKYPVVQSDVVKMRSAAAYDHMKRLEELGFISKEKFGRTFRLKLTPKFFEYFDLPSAQAKEAFLARVPAEIINQAENVEKETDEVERLIDLEEKENVAREEIKKAMGSSKRTSQTEKEQDEEIMGEVEEDLIEDIEEEQKE
ncbi:SMC-Scp complex subunit ScpB [Candidatus Woesearchaeota archaeon]|nr:SMC-Scp complex subunit ScpB [Candidatus Woesearchaeota archaeon]